MALKYIYQIKRMKKAKISNYELTKFRCSCQKGLTYKCRIWNEIEEGFEYSAFYRKPGKLFRSKLTTDPVDLSLFITADIRGVSSK